MADIVDSLLNSNRVHSYQPPMESQKFRNYVDIPAPNFLNAIALSTGLDIEVPVKFICSISYQR